jgi:phosphonate transport system substrate-binding protein
VIAASPPVPNCTFFALPHVDADTAEKVREALLALSDRDFVAVNGERLNVLHRNGTKGYVPARDEEFDILRKMARAANLPPYEKY